LVDAILTPTREPSLLSSQIQQGPGHLRYASPNGYEPLRKQLARYLRRARGMSCDADQIVVVNGSQQAFDLIARVLLDPGDAVVIEEPSYSGARLIFETVAAKLLRVPIDRAGLDVDALPPGKIRLAYVTPCHQFPTGVIMPTSRRLALLDWASRTGAYLIEDDYVSEYRYEGRPLEPLQTLDHAGIVIYVGTLSKVLFPVLRIAYLVLPTPLVRPFVVAKFLADRFSPTLAQQTLTDFMDQGQFDRHLRRSCARNAKRCQVLTSALKTHFGDRVEIAGENAGVHLLVWFNDSRRKTATPWWNALPAKALESIRSRPATHGRRVAWACYSAMRPSARQASGSGFAVWRR